MKAGLTAVGEPYLIAHLVRSQPAFDIAERMECPHCRTFDYVEGQAVSEVSPGCDECSGEGFWWIIPLVGHRARPYEYWKLSDVANIATGPAPPSWPDHYRRGTDWSDEPREVKGQSQLALDLGLIKPKAEIKRRI